MLTGSIPMEMSLLSKLARLEIDDNKLTGPIPDVIGNLSLLTELYLYSNKLEGHIPSSLQNCKELNVLNLADNRLSVDCQNCRLTRPNFTKVQVASQYETLQCTLCSLPRSTNAMGIGTSIALVLPAKEHECDISFVLGRPPALSLSGSIPSQIKDLKMLSELDLSYNNFLGTITSSLGECISLTKLYLSGNIFQGIIPSSLASLRGLEVLDISQNNLSGKIPQFFDKRFSLEFFNLSFNDFEGEVPVVGVFANASAFSVLGNNKLCGGLVILELPKCKEKRSKKKRFPFFILFIVIAPTLLIVLCCVYLFYKKKRSSPPSQSVGNERFLKVSYNDSQGYKGVFSYSKIFDAQGGIKQRVYKGILDSDVDKLCCGVKVLHHSKSRSRTKVFLAECEGMAEYSNRNPLKIY
ncbi:leucine-rich repeat protein [Tanacetum coccineum]